MADLTTPATACCAVEEQATCCEPADKATCCDVRVAGGNCACAAGEKTGADDVRETVRARYAAAARAVAASGVTSCGCGPVSTADASGAPVFGAALYRKSAVGAA